MFRTMNLTPPILRMLCACLLCLPAAVPAASLTLYNDTIASLPGAQGQLFFGADGVVTQTLVPGQGTGLLTSVGVSAGYSNFLVPQPFPVLDRSAGFQLSFELQVVSETHNTNNRAGFSVILLDSTSRGIELGFWEDRIWAQNEVPLFSHGEEVVFDTTSGEVSYELEILNSHYALRADNTEILTGSLRDYAAGPFLPYSLSDYLFIGDNTGSAGAEVILGTVSIQTQTAVPLPAPGLLLLAALPALFGARVRRPGSSAQDRPVAA